MGGRCPGVTVPGLIKAVWRARQRRASKYRGIDNDLELSRAMGCHVSSDDSLRSCSDISDMVDCDNGPTMPGGETFVLPWE
jgi:hypothetical protein